jgi:hypothetical protein
MKKTNRYLLVLLLSAPCLFSLCRKKSIHLDNGLPVVSNERANVFACRRNDIPWISARGSSMEADYMNDTLIVKGKVTKENKTELIQIILNKTNFSVQTIYPLNDTVNAFVSYFASGFTECFEDLPEYGHIATRKITNGSVTLTRLDNKVIAGTFRFDVPADYCDTIRFTDGRFDIQVFQ